MESQLIDQGLMLLIAGMSTVFAFLSVLVAAMAVMSRMIIRSQRSAADGDATAEEIAAISAAISRHRGK